MLLHLQRAEPREKARTKGAAEGAVQGWRTEAMSCVAAHDTFRAGVPSQWPDDR